MRAKKRGGEGGAARQGGAPPCFSRPAARCQPSRTRHCRRVVRLGANTLPGWRAKCPKRRVRRRAGTRPTPRKTSPPPAPPGQRDQRQSRAALSPCFAWPAARCRPSQTRHCRRVVRLGANTLPGLRAKCPKRRVRRRTGTRPHCAKLPGPQRRPDKETASFAKKLRPVSPHRTRHCRFFCVRPGTRTLARGISDTFHDEEKCPF